MKSFTDTIPIDSIGKILLKRKETISVAESVTSGLLQFAFSSAQESSQFFQGGITAFNVAQKFSHLQVEPIHAIRVNGVSANVAEQMALGAAHLFKSHWAVAVTGYATPVPESGRKVFCHFAFIKNHEMVLNHKLSGGERKGEECQLHYTTEILRAFLSVLKKAN